MRVLDLQGVTFGFGGPPVLEDVSLTVETGEFVGIIGPNGSGKTTLLRVMLGLLSPETGTATLFGTPVESFQAWRRVGYVPQRAMLDAALPVTVAEVVATGLVPLLGLFRRPGASGHRRVHEVLNLVGMEAHARSRIGALSAGQQQRVLIARALVTDPELLVLDEPTGGVDPEVQTSFYALLQHLNRERNVTLILVSHDIGVVTKAVTRLACLNRRLLFCGPPADFLTDGALTALYGSSIRIVGHELPCAHAPEPPV
jgi:zinc transport system ATP-binding protein